MNTQSFATVQEEPANDAVAAVPRRSWRMRSVAAHLQVYYRSLLASVRQPMDGNDQLPQVLGITSSKRREGVSTVALNLATAAARSLDEGVLLVDANLAQPTLTRLLNCGGPGLGEFLQGNADLPDCLHRSAYDPFTILPAGDCSGNFAWEANNITALCESLRREFELVVIDFPPVDTWGDCGALAQNSDGLVLVIAAEDTSGGMARRTLDRLECWQVPLLGTVLNGAR